MIGAPSGSVDNETSISVSTQEPSRPTLTTRRSLASMRQSFGASGSGIPATPVRRGSSMASSTVPALPTPTAASRYATVASASGGRKAKALEIGDEVIMDGTDLVGVLRHLGPVAFKPGEYAGLELIGSSTGKGKNDGSVQGVQYFACDPGNGLFCPAHKVSPLSAEAPTEATARPQSAMSSRSGRSSVTGGEYRPPSTTPSHRSRSSTVGIARPPSTTPGRTPSRNAYARPGSSLSSGPSRLIPRKSIADGIADEEGRRRAKTSAEAAEVAEGRITAGSRAHRFLHMNAKDLEGSGKASNAAVDLFGSTSTSGAKTPARSNGPSSPLKDSLLGSSRGASLGVPVTKSRLSMGTPGMSTPRPNKPRISQFGAKSGTSSMLPPSLPGIPTASAEELKKSTNGRSSLTVPARTPSRQSRPSTPKIEEGILTPSVTNRVARNQMLLEELDLTPKRHSTIGNTSDGALERSPERAPEEEVTDADLAAFAITTSDVDEEHDRASVPVALYEESTLETARLKAKLGEIEKELQLSKAEVEKAKVRALQEAQQEREEERRIEKEDETRRRRDLEAKEKEAREKSEGLSRELKKLSDEGKREGLEKEQRLKDVQTQLQDSEKLIAQLKASMEMGGAKSAEAEGRFEAKDLEMQQLKERIDRLTEERKKEREDHLREMDELKAAGEEAFDIFQKEQSLCNDIIRETEDKMALLEAKAQEAIADVVRERDEALQAKPSSVAEIDQQSLKEQLSQAQNRVILLEDQLAESNMIMQQEREAAIKRKERFGENEIKLKTDVAKLKADFKKVSGREMEARARSEELLEALAESKAALESERAELEILRTEALVIGHDQQTQPLAEREKSRLEGEIERLNGLLEGSRSGKREATRQAEEARRETDGLHALLAAARQSLKTAEADRNAFEKKIAGRKSSNDGNAVAELQRSLKEKVRELQALQARSLPPTEQVAKLMENHRQEIQERDDEITVMRQKLDEAVHKHTTGARYSLTVPAGTGSETSQQSPTMSGFGDLGVPLGGYSPNSHRLSSASTFSRKSRNSLGQSPNGSETTLKELAGLRSIVATLNQELTESKVSRMQLEKELSSDVEKWKEEARKWQLTVESMKGSSGGAVGGSTADQDQAIKKRLEVEKKLHEAQQQVQRYKAKMEAVELKKQEETGKLYQDIAELEALCEATVWRREEQDAKRQELERQVEKLQRKLERALNGSVMSEEQAPKPMSGKGEVVCDDCGEKGHLMGDDCPYSKDDMLF